MCCTGVWVLSWLSWALFFINVSHKSKAWEDKYIMYKGYLLYKRIEQKLSYKFLGKSITYAVALTPSLCSNRSSSDHR
jgi:hypothetical protein